MAMYVEKLRENLHDRLERSLEPLARWLTGLRVLPNHVTTAGLGANLLAAGLIVADQLALAGVAWLLAGGLDLLDGALARSQGKATRFGAFLDSTVDRVSEGVVFSAIAYRFAVLDEPVNAALVVLALLGSLLVSYTRARTEALGARCKVGLVTRPERVLLLAVGLCLNLLPVVIYLLVSLTAVTVVQRIRHAFQELSTES
jgi:CDP-diacylglycerol--glycerol-3-phosphate 3-phosphatidyltransferase